jgi:YHS domain-containing protein
MKVRTAVAVLAGAFALALTVHADDAALKCPVSGKPAKKEASADYQGKKVYFCCEGCPAAFTKDPSKFAAKANQQLVASKQVVQVCCPLSGGPINPKTAIDIDGSSVAFCCNNCKAKAEKSEDKASLVFANLKKAFTDQTTCPVSGKPISPKNSVVYNGKKVYFCCGGCPEAFNKDPEKFASKLPADSK